MVGALLLLTLPEAGLFILISIGGIFTLGSLGAWNYFKRREVKLSLIQENDTNYIPRLIKSVGVSFILILLFILILVIWDPTFE